MKHNWTENDDSTQRALQFALDAIEKQFGPGAIVRVQKAPDQRSEAIAEIARVAKIPTINSQRFRSSVFVMMMGA